MGDDGAISKALEWAVNVLLAAFVALLAWNGRRLVGQVESHASELKGVEGVKQAVQKLDGDVRDIRDKMDKSRDQTAEEVRRLHAKIDTTQTALLTKMDANHSAIIAILLRNNGVRE